MARKMVKHGLAHLKDYNHKVFTLDARTSGLPHRRRRVFITLVHKDVKQNFEKFDKLLSMVKSHPVKPSPMDSFVHDEIPMEGQKKKRAKIAPQKISKKSKQQVLDFRKEFGLPPPGSKGARPFTSTATSECLESMSSREKHLLDCIFCYFIKTLGHVPDDLMVNVNETLPRRPWLQGGVRVMSTGMKLYYHKIRNIVNVATKFQMMGWCPDDLVIPAVLSESSLSTMLGNMIAIPTIGTVEVLTLLCFQPQFAHLTSS